MFWYKEEIQKLEKKEVIPKCEKPRLVFYGSSSLRLWPEIESIFPEFDVINQAFGGSTLAACCWYFEKLIPPVTPDIMVIYAGDNDLGDGRHPEEVFFFFKILMGLIEEHCGNIPVAYISIKPSFAREYLLSSIIFTNKIIREEIHNKHPNGTYVNVFDEMLATNQKSRILYEDGDLHMGGHGYTLWKKVLMESFLQKFISLKCPG